MRTLLTLLLLCGASTQGAGARESTQSTAPFDTPFDKALQRNVHDGLVDYAGMKKDVDFDMAVKALAVLDPGRLETKTERLAFWINAYNALVIRQVLDHYPIASVSEVGLAGRWSFFKFTEFIVGGKPHTLDQIEHEIIRPLFEEPRAHFALVCGSMGCPFLRNGIWHADRLDHELDDAARAFINDPSRVQIDSERGVLRLSRVFEWYKADFEKAAGSVESFLKRYRTGDAIRPGLHVEYIEYSWSLNDRKGSISRD